MLRQQSIYYSCIIGNIIIHQTIYGATIKKVTDNLNLGWPFLFRENQYAQFCQLFRDFKNKKIGSQVIIISDSKEDFDKSLNWSTIKLGRSRLVKEFLDYKIHYETDRNNNMFLRKFRRKNEIKILGTVEKSLLQDHWNTPHIYDFFIEVIKSKNAFSKFSVAKNNLSVIIWRFFLILRLTYILLLGLLAIPSILHSFFKALSINIDLSDLSIFIEKNPTITFVLIITLGIVIFLTYRQYFNDPLGTFVEHWNAVSKLHDRLINITDQKDPALIASQFVKNLPGQDFIIIVKDTDNIDNFSYDCFNAIFDELIRIKKNVLMIVLCKIYENKERFHAISIINDLLNLQIRSKTIIEIPRLSYEQIKEVVLSKYGRYKRSGKKKRNFHDLLTELGSENFNISLLTKFSIDLRVRIDVVVDFFIYLEKTKLVSRKKYADKYFQEYSEWDVSEFNIKDVFMEFLHQEDRIVDTSLENLSDYQYYESLLEVLKWILAFPNGIGDIQVIRNLSKIPKDIFFPSLDKLVNGYQILTVVGNKCRFKEIETYAAFKASIWAQWNLNREYTTSLFDYLVTNKNDMQNEAVALLALKSKPSIHTIKFLIKTGYQYKSRNYIGRALLFLGNEGAITHWIDLLSEYKRKGKSIISLIDSFEEINSQLNNFIGLLFYEVGDLYRSVGNFDETLELWGDKWHTNLTFFQDLIETSLATSIQDLIIKIKINKSLLLFELGDWEKATQALDGDEIENEVVSSEHHTSIEFMRAYIEYYSLLGFQAENSSAQYYFTHSQREKIKITKEALIVPQVYKIGSAHEYLLLTIKQLVLIINSNKIKVSDDFFQIVIDNINSINTSEMDVNTHLYYNLVCALVHKHQNFIVERTQSRLKMLYNFDVSKNIYPPEYFRDPSNTILTDDDDSNGLLDRKLSAYISSINKFTNLIISPEIKFVFSNHNKEIYQTIEKMAEKLRKSSEAIHAFDEISFGKEVKKQKNDILEIILELFEQHFDSITDQHKRYIQNARRINESLGFPYLNINHLFVSEALSQKVNKNNDANNIPEKISILKEAYEISSAYNLLGNSGYISYKLGDYYHDHGFYPNSARYYEYALNCIQSLGFPADQLAKLAEKLSLIYYNTGSISDNKNLSISHNVKAIELHESIKNNPLYHQYRSRIIQSIQSLKLVLANSYTLIANYQGAQELAKNILAEADELETKLGETYKGRAYRTLSNIALNRDKNKEQALENLKHATTLFRNAKAKFWLFTSLYKLLDLSQDQYDEFHAYFDEIFEIYESEKNKHLRPHYWLVTFGNFTSKIAGFIKSEKIVLENRSSDRSNYIYWFEKSFEYFSIAGEFYPALEKLIELSKLAEQGLYSQNKVYLKMINLLSFLEVDISNFRSVSAIHQIHKIYSKVVGNDFIELSNYDLIVNNCRLLIDNNKFLEASELLDNCIHAFRVKERNSLSQGEVPIPENWILDALRLKMNILQKSNEDIVTNIENITQDYARLSAIKISANLYEIGVYFENSKDLDNALRMYFLAGRQSPDNNFAKRARKKREAICENPSFQKSEYCN